MVQRNSRGNPNYRRGRSFEHRVKARLEKLGYFVVRAAGSKGVADLVAVSPEHTLLVQCTTSEESKSQEYRRNFLNVALECGGVPVLVWKEYDYGKLHWLRLDGDRLSWAPGGVA